MRHVTDLLFNKRYWMHVQERAFHSEEEITEYGVFGITDINDLDTFMSSMRPANVTIVDMCYYLNKGFAMSFHNAKDIPEVYNIIHTHLENWRLITNLNGYIDNIPPIEDFEMLDALAEKLFPFREATVSTLSKIKNSLFASKTYDTTGGVYKPYAPLLFKYCQMVNEVK